MALDMTEWNRIQQDAREGKWGDFRTLRHLLCERASAENPGEGISSSDVNHMVYGMFRGNENMTAAEVMDELRHYGEAALYRDMQDEIEAGRL